MRLTIYTNTPKFNYSAYYIIYICIIYIYNIESEYYKAVYDSGKKNRVKYSKLPWALFYKVLNSFFISNFFSFFLWVFYYNNFTMFYSKVNWLFENWKIQWFMFDLLLVFSGFTSIVFDQSTMLYKKKSHTIVFKTGLIIDV